MTKLLGCDWNFCVQYICSHNQPLTYYVPLNPLQTQRSEHLIWDWGHRAREVGPGPLSPSSVGYLLLLHLEGSQIHWESECWGIDTSCAYCVAWMLFGLCFYPNKSVTKHCCLEKTHMLGNQVNLVDLETWVSVLSWMLLFGQTLCRLYTVDCRTVALSLFLLAGQKMGQSQEEELTEEYY